MRRSFTIVLILLLAVSMSGCGTTWGQKFIRRKKDVKKTPKIVQIQKYPMKPTPELYKKHYSYFITWQSELLSELGENRKKDIRSLEEAISNLRDMQNILVPEWGDKMQKYVDREMEAREIIIYQELSKYNVDSVRSTLEKVDRAIKRDFCYSRVKDHLKKDMNENEDVEEGPDQ